MDIQKAIRAAVNNIAKHGDTDIFPFPFENHIFFDRPEECCDLLLKLHNNFETYLATYPPFTIESLTPVGYTGFRWATQIEPFWNAYYLALTIAVADQIESTRISEAEKVVFSYRYSLNEEDAKLFADSTWRDFRSRSMDLSHDSKYVVLTDISDFYPRIYHHRMEKL